MVEEESLEQVGSVNFDINFFEEWLVLETEFSNFVLNEVIRQVRWIIQIECFDGIWRESEALDRVQTIGWFTNVIHDHDRVPETSIANNHLHKIFVWKRETKLAADVESDFIAR